MEGRISSGSRYQELREAEVRYRTLLEQIPAITYTQVADETSPTGFRDIYISPQTLPVLGYTAQEWQADSELWIKVTHPEDRDHVIDADQTAGRSGERYLDEYRMIARDGRVVWFRDEAVYVEDPVTGLGFWQGVMLDITEQKRAEKERADTESKYQALVERIPALIYTEVTDESRPSGSRATFVGPFSEVLLGYTSEELVNDPQLWDLMVHPDDRGRIFDLAQTAEASGRPFSHEYRVVRKDGKIRWVYDEATLIDEPKNGFLIWQGFMLDITERKDAEEQLRQAELRYRSLVEHLPAVVYIDAIDDLSTAMYVSPKYETLVGYTAEERMGDPGLWLRLIHPADREWVLAESKRTNRTGDPWAVEYRVIARDGRVVWVQDEAEVIRDETGAPLYWQGVLLDISERKHAEQGLAEALEQLRSLDRLKNTLLHTLSHDLKGPLTAILGADIFSSTVAPQVGDTASATVRAPRAVTYVSEIQTEALRDQAARDVAPRYDYTQEGASAISDAQVAQFRQEARRVDAAFALDDGLARRSALDPLFPELSPDARTTLVALDAIRWATIREAAAQVLGERERIEIKDTEVVEEKAALPGRFPLAWTSAEKQLAAELVAPFVTPNSSYSASLTEAARTEARQAVAPVAVTVKPNSVVVEVGARVTEADAEVSRLNGSLEERGANIGTIDNWGKRRFAYELRHQTEGYYQLVVAEGDPAAFDEFSRVAALSDKVLRHKIVRLPETAAKAN